MRIAAFIGAVILADLITLGGIVLLVLASPERQLDVVWLAVVALTTFVYGPLMLGSFLSYWEVRSHDSRRYFRWWLAVVAGAQLLGAIAIVVFGMLTGAAPWLPLVFIAAAALLNLLAVVVARALYRRDEARRPAEPRWEPITRRQIMRKIVIVTVTFVGILVVGAIGFSLLFAFSTGRHRTALTPLLFAIEFAFMGAAFACILVTLPLNRRLRENVSRDIGRLRKLGKVVLRGKPIELTTDERIAAEKYAVLISIILPFTLAYLALLYVGIGLQQVTLLQDGHGSPLSFVFPVLLVLLIVVIAPLYVIRIRRARAYAAAHRDLLTTSTDGTAGTAGTAPAAPATD